MPWVCPKCRFSYDLPGPPQPAHVCQKTDVCRKAGAYATCNWVAAPVAVAAVVLTDEQQAAALGYTARTNTSQGDFPNGHRTGSMFLNAGASRGVSADGSTHAGGRASWKCFTVNGNEYRYRGTFQRDLNQWPHRPVQNFEGPFPMGTA